jgi:hypothetical protein
MASNDSLQTNEVYTQKQSRIYETNSYVNLGENLTVKQARQLAYANARAKVIENHKTYLKSSITVKNGEAVSSTVDAISEGSVRVIEDKDYGVISGGRYHVWIRAEVCPGVEKEELAQGQSNSQLSVKMWTKNKKDSYGKDERLTILLKGNMDFYAIVANVRPDGDLTLLLPNKYRENNHFKANTVYQIPGNEDIFKLTVGEPFGTEKMIIYASVEPLNGQLFSSGNKIFYEYKGSLKTLSQKVRAINVELDEGKDFCEGVLVIQTHQ